jgi:hypothetical protein
MAFFSFFYSVMGKIVLLNTWRNYYKRVKIHIMAKKSSVQRLESYIYEVDVWSPKIAQRDDWCDPFFLDWLKSYCNFHPK